MRCIVLTARRYQFQDKDSGRQVEGVSMTYTDPEEQLAGDEQKGLALMTVSGPLDLWEQLPALPAVCDLDFRQRPGPKGRPTLQLVGVDLVGPCRVAAVAG